MTFTLVTCLYDLQKREPNNKTRRSIDTYLNLTQDISFNMVIFCDPNLEEEIRKRKTKGNCIIKQIPLEDLYYYKLYNEIIKQDNMKYSIKTDKNTYNYHLLTWNKFSMIKDVIKENPFKTDYFYWIDYGLKHVFDEKNINLDFNVYLNRLNNIDFKEIRFVIMNDLNLDIINNENYYNSIKQYCAGGLFGGYKDNFINLINIFDNKLKELIDKNIVSLEEQIIADIIVNNMKLFNLTYGDYQDIVTNFVNINTNIDYLQWIINKNFDTNKDKFISYDCAKKISIVYLYDLFIKLYDKKLHKECYDLGIELLKSNINRFDVYFKTYITAYYYKKELAFEIYTKFINEIYTNQDMKNIYLSNKDFYDQQFQHIFNNIAIVVISNYKYFNKACDTIDQIIKNGKWNNDIIYLYGNDMIDKIDKLEYIKNTYNVILKYFPDIDTTYRIEKIKQRPFTTSDGREYRLPFQFHKLHTFNTYFKKWKRILYIDAGYSCFQSLYDIINLNCNNSFIALEETNHGNFTNQWEQLSQKDLYDKLISKYNIKCEYFMNGIYYYDTNIIKEDTFNELCYLMNYYTNAKTNEMPIMNLYFMNIWKKLPLKNIDNKYYLMGYSNENNKKEDYILVKYLL